MRVITDGCRPYAHTESTKILTQYGEENIDSLQCFGECRTVGSFLFSVLTYKNFFFQLMTENFKCVVSVEYVILC